jgi:SAM-dependent methyltransferase
LSQSLVIDDFMLKIMDRLACPNCHTQLIMQDTAFYCSTCGRVYPITDHVADMRLSIPRTISDLDDWTKHWSSQNQENIAQKFFSFYRKVVFARTVEYFINRYFPAQGVFVEAGCGTAETSVRIDKLSGDRTLVAVDIVMPVVKQAHPVMDVRLCGDIFQLPFLDKSVDGLWNVGVMEHFTHSQIDRILREFNRVLKPGAPMVLLWPANDSIPQKILRGLEKVINIHKSEVDMFRFHPAEISKLKSSKEGNDVLTRNGFGVFYIDFGFRSLMAFKTLVGFVA